MMFQPSGEKNQKEIKLRRIKTTLRRWDELGSNTAQEPSTISPTPRTTSPTGVAAQQAAPDSTASCTTEELGKSNQPSTKSTALQRKHCRLIACAFEKKVRLHSPEHELHEKISSSKI